jgi:hypothetical protein
VSRRSRGTGITGETAGTRLHNAAAIVAKLEASLVVRWIVIFNDKPRPRGISAPGWRIAAKALLTFGSVRRESPGARLPFRAVTRFTL